MTLNERRIDLLVIMQLHPADRLLYLDILREIEHLIGTRTYGNDQERKQANKRLKELGVD